MTIEFTIPLLSVTLLDAHIAFFRDKEADLTGRGKANAAVQRAIRLQLEAVRDDILNHEIMIDEDKRIAHFDEILARLLCVKDGMDPDFVGTTKSFPNWKFFTAEERKKSFHFRAAQEELINAQKS